MIEPRSPGRRLWRGVAVAAEPPMVALWALWRDLYLLDAGGLVRRGGAGAAAEWAMLTAATVGLGALFWAGPRPLRVLAYTLYALLLSVACGIAAVLAVMHAFGGPEGDLSAPAWALAALGGIAVLCVVSLLATAALIVEDVRAGDAEEGPSGEE